MKHIMSTATDDIFKVMDLKVTEVFSDGDIPINSSPLKTISYIFCSLICKSFRSIGSNSANIIAVLNETISQLANKRFSFKNFCQLNSVLNFQYYDVSERNPFNKCLCMYGSAQCECGAYEKSQHGAV